MQAENSRCQAGSVAGARPIDARLAASPWGPYDAPMKTRATLPTLIGLSLFSFVGCAPEPEVPATPTWPVLTSPVAEDAGLEARIDSLLSRMTLEEKVGQMVQAEIQGVTPEDVRRYHIGSVLNGGGSWPDTSSTATVGDWVALADALYDASIDTTDGGVAIPITWGTDAVHGHNNVRGATLYPHNVALGAARAPDLIERIGAATALEVRATGIDWTFAPTVAVARDDRWGRTYESWSEDPELVREYAGRMVAGLQGAVGTPAFLSPDHVVATAKHYIGDGGTDGGVDQGDNLSTEADLIRLHLPGYVAALEAGVQTVMASFNSWNGEKLHGHRYLLTEILKERMGFDGFIVSDWNGIGQVAGCAEDSCPQAILAGIDLFMVPYAWQAFIENTLAQVRAGEIPETRIDDAVRRILRVKLRAGLFTAGRPSSRPHAGDASLIGHPDHRALAREAVRRSLVLLKNAGGLLPLSPDVNVLVTGASADDIGRQAGGWSVTWQGTGLGNDDFPGATSIFDGIRAAVAAGGGTATLSPDGTYGATPDVAVVVFGEPPYAEGEGDLETLSYSARDSTALSTLRTLRAAGVPTVSVFLSGRPLWVNPELNASTAFVAAWLPGSEGAGVADVLFRDGNGEIAYDVTGRLPFSWPGSPLQSPLNVGDPRYDPLFPYGFGLGYADRDTLADDLDETDVSPDTSAAAEDVD